MAIENLEALAHKTDVYKTVTLAAPGFTDWYAMPQGVRITAVEVAPGTTSSVRVETTLDLDIDSDGSEAGVVWPSGNVSVRTPDTFNGGALIRMVVVSGSGKLILRGVLS